MKTSLLLTLLPFITSVIASSKLRPLTRGASLSNNPLQARQGYCSDPLDSVCDGTNCIANCCGLGDGSGCRFGFSCFTFNDGIVGCCRDGEDCSEEDLSGSCISYSSSACPGHEDCCSEESPYCTISLGNSVCSANPGVPGDMETVDDEEYYNDEEEYYEEDDVPAVTTSRRPAPTTPSFNDEDETEDELPAVPTKKPSPVEDEVEPTPTKRPSSNASADDAEETPESDSEGGFLDSITSKAGDLAKSAATDLVNDALGGGASEESKGESAAVRQVVGMGVAVGLGAVLGGMVLM